MPLCCALHAEVAYTAATRARAAVDRASSGGGLAPEADKKATEAAASAATAATAANAGPCDPKERMRRDPSSSVDNNSSPQNG